MLRMLMPASIAASGLEEQARIARPLQGVVAGKTCSASTTTATVPSTHKHLRRNGRAQELDGRHLVAGEVGQRAHLFVPDMQRGFLDDDGEADGDDDQVQDRVALQPAETGQLQQAADQRDDQPPRPPPPPAAARNAPA